MQKAEIADQVQDHIRKNFLYDEKKILDAEESLLHSGVVDSTGILELIAFLEEKFSLKFEDHELIAANFDSVAKISSFIFEKISQE